MFISGQRFIGFEASINKFKYSMEMNRKKINGKSVCVKFKSNFIQI
jgi:hypothetical protein